MSDLRITRNFFDDKAPDWDYHACPEKQEQMRAVFREYSSERLNPLLDLGCGSGILHSVLPGNIHMTELDVSFGMVHRVKEKYAQRKPNLLQADAHALPLRPAQYKTVVCFQSFPHFSQPFRVITEVHRVLVLNGLWIIMHLMDHVQLNALHREAGQAVAGDRLPEVSALAEMLQSRRFSVLTCREEKELYLIVARKE